MKSLKTGSDGNGVSSEGENAEGTNSADGPTVIWTADPRFPLFDANMPDYEHLAIEPLFEDQVVFGTFSKSDFRAVKWSARPYRSPRSF